MGRHWVVADGFIVCLDGSLVTKLVAGVTPAAWSSLAAPVFMEMTNREFTDGGSPLAAIYVPAKQIPYLRFPLPLAVGPTLLVSTS